MPLESLSIWLVEFASFIFIELTTCDWAWRGFIFDWIGTGLAWLWVEVCQVLMVCVGLDFALELCDLVYEGIHIKHSGPYVCVCAAAR